MCSIIILFFRSEFKGRSIKTLHCAFRALGISSDYASRQGPSFMKGALKLLANLVAVLLVLPAFLLYRLAALLVGKDRAFPGWSQAFALLPGVSGVYLRRA